MRQSDTITKVFIQHKAEIILRNGPLEELAGNGLTCFHRLMDIFCEEGPGDKRDTNWWCILDSILRRNPGKATFRQTGTSYTIVMSNSEWSPSHQGKRGLLGLTVTVPAKGWTYDIPSISLGSNVGSILTIDKYMPELVLQADTIAMLASIQLTEREASR